MKSLAIKLSWLRVKLIRIEIQVQHKEKYEHTCNGCVPGTQKIPLYYIAMSLQHNNDAELVFGTILKKQGEVLGLLTLKSSVTSTIGTTLRIGVNRRTILGSII